MTGREAIGALVAIARKANINARKHELLTQIIAGLTTWLDSVDELERKYTQSMSEIEKLKAERDAIRADVDNGPILETDAGASVS